MKNYSRHAGIDNLKAISIGFILIWHLNPVTKEMFSSSCSSSFYGWKTFEIFYYYITLTAVPTFILISLYLFIEKTIKDKEYWRKRLIRLIQLFVFWTGIQFIFYLLTKGGLPLPLKTIIPNGGPDLPYVGGSVFYFLFVLIKSILLMFLFLRLPEKLKFAMAVGLIAISTLYFALSPVFKIPIDTMSMKNFYLYIPVAYYVFKYPQQFIRLRVWLMLGYFAAFLYEEFYLNSFVAAYGRLSIFLGTLSFFSIFLQDNFAINKSMGFLSKYSLGIFALHKYWQYIFIVVIGIKKVPQATPPYIVAQQLMLFIATVFFTIVSVYFLGKTRLRKYIS